MAQVYIPDDQKLRQQLEQPSRTPTPRKKTDEGEQVKRQFSGIDIILIVSIIATIALLVAATSRWTARLNPSIQISLSFSVLPAYAGYSLLRMILGYLLSLIFTLIYGHIAATNRRAGMAYTYFASGLPLPYHGPAYSQWRSLECEYRFGICAIQGTNSSYHRIRGKHHFCR